MRRWPTVLAILLAGAALSSCALVSTTAPQRITSQIPFGLPNKTIPGTNGARVRFATQPVYFIDATDNLAPSSRIVTYPAALDTVISQLILGPTDIERSAGYSSDLPKKLVLLSANVRGEIGYVNFATPLNSLSREDQVLAVGQLVLTVLRHRRDAGHRHQGRRRHPACLDPEWHAHDARDAARVRKLA